MQDWQAIVEMSAGMIVVLVALVALRLILGRREPARLTSFELFLTAAFGVGLGIVLVHKAPGLEEAVLALATLALALQLNAQRPFPWPVPRGRAKSEPALLFYGRRCIASGRARAQTTERSICALAEKSGYEGTAGVDAVVLEAIGAIKMHGAQGVSLLAPASVAHQVWKEHPGGSR
ncbi:hypothetical protein [Palleronia sp.]|uniref:hypothetical protein n=1 Tax=Palleronia sp. TaxID=1940284 RepID=UPI0035C7E100